MASDRHASSSRAGDVREIQRVRHSVRENRLTSGVISDEEVVVAIERTGKGWVVELEGQLAKL